MSSRQYSPRASSSRRLSFAALPVASLERDQPDLAAQRPHRLGRAVVGGVVEDEDLVLELGRVVRSIASRQASRCSRPFVFTTQ